MATQALSTTSPQVVRPEATDERFAKWDAALSDLQVRANAPEASEEAVRAAMDEKRQLEGFIASHAAVGPVGYMVKAILLQRTLVEEHDHFASGLAADVVARLRACQ